jgi:hypothetical protein
MAACRRRARRVRGRAHDRRCAASTRRTCRRGPRSKRSRGHARRRPGGGDGRATARASGRPTLDVSLVGRASTPANGGVSLLGDGAWSRRSHDRRAARSRRRGRSAAGRFGPCPGRRLASSRGGAPSCRSGASPAPGLDDAWPVRRARRGDPAALSRREIGRVALGRNRRAVAGSGRKPCCSHLPPSLGAAPTTGPAASRDLERDRDLSRRIRRPRGPHELAARPQPGGLRCRGPPRRPPQRVDPGLGRPCPAPRSRPSLSGSHLPPAARRARFLGEPAAARHPGRALHPPGGPRARLQRRPSGRHGGVGTGHAAPGAAGLERPARGLHRRRVLRRGRASLGAPGAPAGGGHAVPALRPPGLRPFLGKAKSGTSARAGARARASRVFVDLSRRCSSP